MNKLAVLLSVVAALAFPASALARHGADDSVSGTQQVEVETHHGADDNAVEVEQEQHAGADDSTQQQDAAPVKKQSQKRKHRQRRRHGSKA